jgi:hypothetical protein
MKNMALQDDLLKKVKVEAEKNKEWYRCGHEDN